MKNLISIELVLIAIFCIIQVSKTETSNRKFELGHGKIGFEDELDAFQSKAKSNCKPRCRGGAQCVHRCSYICDNAQEEIPDTGSMCEIGTIYNKFCCETRYDDDKQQFVGKVVHINGKCDDGAGNKGQCQSDSDSKGAYCRN